MFKINTSCKKIHSFMFIELHSNWNQAVVLCVDVGWLANNYCCDPPKTPDHRTPIIYFLVLPQGQHDECLSTVAHRRERLCTDDRLPSWKSVIKGHGRSPVLKTKLALAAFAIICIPVEGAAAFSQLTGSLSLFINFKQNNEKNVDRPPLTARSCLSDS